MKLLMSAALVLALATPALAQGYGSSANSDTNAAASTQGSAAVPADGTASPTKHKKTRQARNSSGSMSNGSMSNGSMSGGANGAADSSAGGNGANGASTNPTQSPAQ